MADSTVLTQASLKARAEGKARREQLPRKDLGILGSRPADFDPVALLEAQGADRVPELVPLRYERMAASKFAFLRGAAAPMAYDLALTPNTGIEAQICGDAHLLNFGIFLSPERRLVFDVNDFDETLPGPFEWDIKRLGASVAVSLDEFNFSAKECEEAVLALAGTYRTAMAAMAEQGNLDVWYSFLDIEGHLKELREAFSTEHGSPVDSIIAKAERSDSKRAFAKLTSFVDGALRFTPDPPLIVPVEDLLDAMGRPVTKTEAIDILMTGYASTLSSDRAHLLNTFEAVDMARKVVGVGSVGTRCFVVLMLGRSLQDPLILQVKEAMPSVLEDHLGPSHTENAGQRVVEGQRMMQTTPDIFLGHHRVNYTETETHDFYVRQLHDGKASVDLSKVPGVAQARDYASICAWTLARAHARSGNRDEIAAYLGASSKAFDKAICEWSMAYIERNTADYQALVDAIDSGRVSTTVPTPSPAEMRDEAPD